MSLRFADGSGDPRFYQVDHEFRQVLADLVPMVSASRMSKARFFHRLSTTAAGRLVLSSELDLPAHAFFQPGRRFDVLARYSNGVEADDIAPAIRGVTLRLHDPGDEEALLDLSLNTGECFFVRTAEIFRHIALGQSARLAEEIGGFRENAWGLYRHAGSYAGYHYYSQAPSGYTAEDGTQWLARYRLLPADDTPDSGQVDPGGMLLPPEQPGLTRDPADRRSRSFLHDELRARVLNHPVRGRLQVQLHPVTESEVDNEAALDCTRPWVRPWRDLAVLELDSLVSNATIEGRRFSHRVAPAELGSVLATSPHENASLNHLRALIYEWTSAVRQGRQPGDELAELLASLPAPTSTTDSTTARSVVVIGAGPAGLTTARELERAGHRVTVLEQQRSVGGKCESTDIDGHAYDLGGHLCTTQYENVARLAVELGVPTEDTTPHRVYDIGTGAAVPQSEAFFERRSFTRYAELREKYFPRIAEAGLAHSAKALAQPVTEWLAEHGLESMAASLGTGYTAAGYGHLADDLPALYFVKYAEMTGLLSARSELLGHTGSFTIGDGFSSLWQKVAAGLDDVRCGVTILRVVRDDRGVRVETDQGTVSADDLVLTVPLDQLLPVLDATEDEKDLAGRVRTMDYYTTIVSATGLPQTAFYLVDEHCQRDAERGRGVSFHHRYPGRDEYAVYSYGAPGLDGDDIVAGFRADVEWMGGQLGEVHTQRRWKFLPHFGSEDILDGVYDRIEALQGARRTFHVGSLPAYELVECNVAYARKLVRDHFGGVSDRERQEARPSFVEKVSVVAVREWLVEHIAEELRLPKDVVDPAASLDTFALESISVAALQAGLTDLLGFRVPHTLFLQCPTIDAVAERLATVEDTDTVMPVSEQDLLLDLGRPRPFFCVGGAVGAAYYLWKLARETESARPFYGVRMPGHDGVTEPVNTVGELATRCLEQVRQVQPDGPYLLGGHSFGGVVAYEMGRQLRAAGQDVERIVLLDSYVVEPGQERPPVDDAAALEELMRINGAAYAEDGPIGVHIDSEADVSERMAQFAKFLGATSSIDVEEYIGAMLRVYQANIEANATHQPGPSDLDVVLLKATDGFPPVMSPHRNTALKLADPANGWEHVELGSLSVVDVPGDHFTMFVGESGRLLASAVHSCLTEAVSGTEG